MFFVLFKLWQNHRYVAVMTHGYGLLELAQLPSRGQCCKADGLLKFEPT